jgi:hypothetical protein
MLQALLFVVLAGFEWWRAYTDLKPQPVLFSLVAIAMVAYAAYRLIRARPELRALLQAHEGEKVVGQFLERLRADGFQVFHDVVGAGFNVDHVLVGPPGVFTVETKTWSKPEKGDARIEFDGHNIRAGSHSPDRDPVSQAKAQAAWLKALLSESSGRSAEVRPVIVFPGWFVANSSGSFRDVWVLEPKALPAFLNNEPVRLLPDEVKLLAFHLSRFIRASEKANET